MSIIQIIVHIYLQIIHIYVIHTYAKLYMQFQEVCENSKAYIIGF